LPVEIVMRAHRHIEAKSNDMSTERPTSPIRETLQPGP
jgi:hypothetical protein